MVELQDKYSRMREEHIHEAWGHSHNQLFTDRHHAEASQDNADQFHRAVAGDDGNNRLDQVQDTPNVVRAKQGEALLSDPEGYSRMWQEKTRFYAGLNPPEALAQSQKGIAEYMALRDGYRARNYEPPPIPRDVGRAMEIVARAPVGAEAHPGAMRRVNEDLQECGFRDMNDAMGKIAAQNELLKWSTPTTPFGTRDLAMIARTQAARNITANEESELQP